MSRMSPFLGLWLLVLTACMSEEHAIPGPNPAGTPSEVVAVAGDGKATLTWRAPSSDGGRPLTKYTVTRQPDGMTVDVSAPLTTAVIVGLTNWTSYTFAVSASNEVGTSGFSGFTAPVTPRGTFDEARSSIEASPTSAPADGNTGIGLTATVRDREGHAMPGIPVQWSLEGDAAALQPVSGLTDKNGLFLGTLTAELPGPRTVSLLVGEERVSTTVSFTDTD